MLQLIEKKRIKKFKKQYNLPVYLNLKNELIKSRFNCSSSSNKTTRLFYKITQLGYKKNFLFEKPFTINKKIIFDLTKIKNRKFFINYYRNFDNILIKTLNRVKNSEKNLLIKAYYSKVFIIILVTISLYSLKSLEKLINFRSKKKRN